jgi:hypothetical protein
MKTILILCCCAVLFCAGYQYATYERENKIDYSGNSMELHTVQCMEENGDLQTYEIPMPEYSGFSKKEEKELMEDYAKGFCDSL